MKNKYDVKRIIPDELSESLDIFLKNYSETGLSDYNTYLFYGFILKSYKLPRENRYSIKLLVKELQVTLIINIYYHALNCLALNDGLKIYGEDFLI
ncbi:TPA: hypothetical protein ACJ84B_002028 [Streptococcus pneumoniae]